MVAVTKCHLVARPCCRGNVHKTSSSFIDSFSYIIITYIFFFFSFRVIYIASLIKKLVFSLSGANYQKKTSSIFEYIDKLYNFYCHLFIDKMPQKHRSSKRNLNFRSTGDKQSSVTTNPGGSFNTGTSTHGKIL